jgi:crotonobetainyl-CoA:carnitine CoA-transferase CaiB-like acyl-CoA transferase
MVDQALDGVIVLELAPRVAARVCGDLLAQLGATVFVIQPDGSCTNYDRRGPLSIDLSAASDRALLHDLATASDALIVSSDTSSPLLIAVPIAVHSIDRVVCDITAFGRFGPLAGVSAGDAEVQAYTGIIDTTGFADAPPMPCAVPVVEYMTGTNAAAAVLAALRARRRLGHGQCVDMALYDSSFLTLSSFLPRILESDTATTERSGNRHTLCAPWNAYRARDGWVVICTGSNSQWQRLTELIGQPELGLDRRYLEMSQRVANVGDADGIVEVWTRTQTVTAAWSA